MRRSRKTWKVVCDRSGFTIDASDARRQWNGLIVHKDFFDPRHPQDTPPTPRQEKPPPFVRPERPDRFISTTSVTKDDL